jgi:excisionase family DNA binding protein
MERMTVEELAKYIGASTIKIYSMVKANEIPHYKIGAKILFRKATIDQWISKQEVQAH